MSEAVVRALEGVEMPAEKRSKVAGDIQCWLDQVAASAVEKASHSFSTIVDTKMREAVQLCETNSKSMIDESEKRMAARLATSESETRSLISALSSQVSAMTVTDAGSVAGTSVAAAANRRAAQESIDFVAKKLEIKGYVDYDAAEQLEGEAQEKFLNEQKLSKPEVDSWISELINKLGEEACTCIDRLQTDKLNSRLLFPKFHIQVKKDTPKDDIDNLRKAIQGLLTTGFGTIRGRTPKCIAEPSPYRKPYHDAAGRMLGFLKRQGIAPEALKPEWGPPLRIFDIRGTRPVEVASFANPVSGWCVYEGALKSLKPTLTAAATVAAVRK